jgi:prepilin-type N-terminal cleavage/methylation domain-containing protein
LLKAVASRCRQSRPGFSLAEVVVTAAVLVIIAAAALPSLSGYYSQKRVNDTRDVLVSLSMSIANQNVAAGERGFGRVVNATRKYPGRLSQLTIPILPADRQCQIAGGATGYAAADTGTTGWKAGAPYSGLNIVLDKGVETPLGWVHDSVVKGTIAAGTTGFAELHIDSVARNDVVNLDAAIDDNVDSTSGMIRFVNATGLSSASNLRLVQFLIPSPVSGTTQIGCAGNNG